MEHGGELLCSPRSQLFCLCDSLPGFSPFPSCVDDCHEEGRGRGYRGEDGMEEKFLRIFNLAVLLNNYIRIGKRIIIRFDGNRFVNTIVDKIPRAMIGR